MLADRRKGDGEDQCLPLLLLPGTLCDARIFLPMQQRLPEIATQVVLTTEARLMEDAAERVLAAAPERFALLGFSLGGMVAMEVALRAPERVAGLALISTSPRPVTPEQHPHRRAAVLTAKAAGMREFTRERLWPGYGALPGDAAALQLLEDMAESLGHTVFAQQTELALGRGDFCPRLGAVKCPVLVVAGTEDKVCPPEAQADLVRALPGCTYMALHGADHLTPLEKPDEVAAAVAAWFHTTQRVMRA